eukprot:scaffold67110_cov48-Cyclotella_meneghiniana.AAC.2
MEAVSPQLGPIILPYSPPAGIAEAMYQMCCRIQAVSATSSLNLNQISLFIQNFPSTFMAVTGGWRRDILICS